MSKVEEWKRHANAMAGVTAAYLREACDRIEELEKMLATEDWIHRIASDARIAALEAQLKAVTATVDTKDAQIAELRAELSDTCDDGSEWRCRAELAESRLAIAVEALTSIGSNSVDVGDKGSWRAKLARAALAKIKEPST